jgi:putative ABC transport system permease protein
MDIATILRSGFDAVTVTSTRHFRTLVAIELALALSLVSSAAVLMRAASRLQTVDVGYDTKPLVLGTVHTARSVGPQSDVNLAGVVDRARMTEGVLDAAAWQTVPTSGAAIVVDNGAQGRRQYGSTEFAFQLVTPSFLQTFMIPVMSGRDFLPAAGEWQAIVDERMATQCWGASNPVGRTIKLGAAHTSAPEARVVGMASRFRMAAPAQHLFDAPAPACPSGQLLVVAPFSDSSRIGSSPFVQFAARAVTQSGRSSLAIRRSFGEDERTFRLLKAASYDDVTGLASQRASHNFVAALFTVFSLIAVTLAAIGVFAVVADSVSQRQRDFGIRLALGARPSQIRFLAVQQMRVVILVAVTIGLVLTSWSANLVSAFLILPEDRYDPVTFGLALVCLLIVSVIAAYLPAHAAARLDPVDTLRHE